MNNIEKALSESINKFSGIERKKKKQANLISNIRLIIVLLGIGLAVLFWRSEQAEACWGVVLLTVLIFGYFVKKHDKIFAELKKLSCIIEINQNNLARTSSKWNDFVNDGKEFMNPKHSFVNDLDIFGPKSLFQWLNITNTFHGRQILKTILETPETNIKELQIRQNVIKELAKKTAFCEDLQCEGMLAKGIGNDPRPLLAYVNNSRKNFKKSWLKAGCRLLVLITVLFILAIPIIPSSLIYIPLALIIIQGLISLFGYAKLSSILNTVHNFRENIKIYEKLIKKIELTEFDEPRLRQMKNSLAINNRAASAVMKKLDNIAEAIDLHYNPISYMVLNFLLLWDYHCVFALEEWKDKYGRLIEEWFYTIGRFEALASLALIARLNPEWTFPKFTEDGTAVFAENLGHPLIPAEQRVCNDVDIKNEICIITGSNMSGKTTLLRTIGINLVLAYAGAPVCASRVECSIMDIFTSMRISDDLGNGISTFYAELLRIKMIIDHLKKKQKMIFLIDEIFRGTNSNDRITGAISVVKNLSKPWVIGLVSTHDFELCSIKTDNNKEIANYHFTENYVGDKIYFDYKLRSGRCNSTNAKYLMQLVGIEVVD
ncbi:MAG: mismatch repair protein MutS domain protein [Firmicutes bacterium]|nr:mismatch repair protein MutS domain protein [Bacillota bacterium]